MALSLKYIRKIHYKGQRKKIKELWFDIDDWIKNPYSCFKARYFIETSSIIAFILQYTKITPNFVTLIFALAGALSGILLASNNQDLIFIGLVLLFTKSSLDWADGLLARIKKKTSELGSLLDDWGGLVGSYSYLCGLGIYLYNKTNEEHFIILAILIIAIKAIDLKNYAYHFTTYQIMKFNKKRKNCKKNNIKNKNTYGVSSNLILIKNFFQNFLDERSRNIDLICLLILIDTFFMKVFIIEYLYYLIFLNNFVLFCGGFYIMYFKNFISKIK